MQKFIMCYWSACCCLHIVYKHFGRSLHIGPLDPTCVQSFRPIPLMVFEILGFKLKNDDDKNKWTFCHIISIVGGSIVTKL